MRSLTRLASLCACALLVAACGDGGGAETGRARGTPDVLPPRLSPVRILPPTLEPLAPARVEVRNPAALPATQVDLFKQGPGRVDVLWVIDDSGSMANQRLTLAGNFERFLQALESLQTDFHVGVITTNANDGGKLVGTVKVIDPQTADRVNVFLSNTTFPASRTRWEQGLRMMELALTEPNRSTHNAGFLRPEAALAVIAVSDEDDGSFGDPGYYARFLRGALGKGNENLVSFSVIGGTLPNGCYPPGEQIFWGGLAEPATRYATVANRTGGIVGSICDASFEQTLVRIAEAIHTLRRIFPLSLVPDPATLRVTVNGANVPRDVVNGWQYRADTRSITFLGNFVPPPGAELRITYALSP